MHMHQRPHARLKGGGGRGGGGGSGTQNFVFQKWPNKIFPIINFFQL